MEQRLGISGSKGVFHEFAGILRRQAAEDIAHGGRAQRAHGKCPDAQARHDRLTYVSPRVAKYGYSPEQVIGRNLLDLVTRYALREGLVQL